MRGSCPLTPRCGTAKRCRKRMLAERGTNVSSTARPILLVMPERRSRLRMGYLRGDDVKLSHACLDNAFHDIQHAGIAPGNDISVSPASVESASSQPRIIA